METEAPKKERNSKPAFDLTSAIDADGNPIPLNEGLLTAVPYNVDISVCRAPGKKYFEKEEIYWEFKIRLAEQKIARIQEQIEDYRTSAKEAAGDLTPEAQAKRAFAKLQRQKQKLMEKMAELGINPEDLE